MTPRIAFLGMGLMGQAMTKNLVAFGNLDKPLTLYNRTKTSADDHSSKIGNSQVVATVEEAVKGADIIWSCLQDERAVDAIYRQIFLLDLTGKLFVDSSTIPPEIADAIAKQVIDKGGEYVAMPVMGEPSMAEHRLLICIAAGEPESIEKIKPYVAGVVGRSLIELSGESPGRASLLKLMGNVLIMNTIESVAEVNVFAEKCGLGTDNMQKLMSTMFPGPPHSIYNSKMLSGDYYLKKPMVEVTKARELSSHVLSLAKSTGTSLKAYEVAARHLETVESNAGPSADILGIYGAVRLESGLGYESRSTQ